MTTFLSYLAYFALGLCLNYSQITIRTKEFWIILGIVVVIDVTSCLRASK